MAQGHISLSYIGTEDMELIVRGSSGEFQRKA
jgi:hypothetical protein